jgi:hypothetical protein
VKALLRLVVLVALLLASGPLQWRYSLQRMRVNMEGMVASLPFWLGLVAIAVVFLLVLSAWRDERGSAVVSVIEGFVAAVLALVPPLIWTQVVGAGLFLDAMGGTTGMTFAQVLAIVWLVTVVRSRRTGARSA